MNDWRKWLFYLAGLYDAALGAAFFLSWRFIYDAANVTRPNHPGYAQFPALLLIIFGLMFFRIARDPDANRDLIVYGMLLKAAYAGLVLWYHFTSVIPSMWVYFAWADIAFLVLFFVAWRSERKAVVT